MYKYFLLSLIIVTQALAQLDPVANNANALVSIGYDSLATSILLSNGSGSKFPQPSTDGAFNVMWWNSTDYTNPSNDPFKEIIRVTSRSGDTLKIIIRAQEGTLATPKNLNGKTYRIFLGVTAKTITDIKNSLESKLSIDSIENYAILMDTSNTNNGESFGETIANGKIPLTRWSSTANNLLVYGLNNNLTFTWTVKDTVKTGGEVLPGWKIPYGITITEISSYCDANTVTFNIEEREETTPNTSGVVVLSSSQIANSTQQKATSFSNAVFAKDTWMVPVISAAGDVSLFSITVRYKFN
jgi:hypothetical protein